jgi:hypothetical protein
MRLVFNRSHGENPMSFGAADSEEVFVFVELELFISEACKNSARNCGGFLNDDEMLQKQGGNRGTQARFDTALPFIRCPPKHRACQCPNSAQRGGHETWFAVMRMAAGEGRHWPSAK